MIKRLSIISYLLMPIFSQRINLHCILRRLNVSRQPSEFLQCGQEISNSSNANKMSENATFSEFHFILHHTTRCIVLKFHRQLTLSLTFAILILYSMQVDTRQFLHRKITPSQQVKNYLPLSLHQISNLKYSALIMPDHFIQQRETPSSQRVHTFFLVKWTASYDYHL